MEKKIVKPPFNLIINTYSRQTGGVLLIVGCVILAVLFFPKILPNNWPWPRHTAYSTNTISQTMSGNYLAADYAFKQHNFNDASKLFIESLLKAPDNVQILNNTYLVLLLSGQVEDALTLILRYNSENNALIASNTLLALKEIHEGNYDKASDILTTISPDNTAVDSIITPFLLSWCDVGKNNYTEALDRLRNMPVNDNNRSFVAYQIALIYDIAKQNEEAEKNFSLALENAEHSYRFIKASGNFYERVGQKEKAATLYNNYMVDTPSSNVFKKDLERINKQEYAPPPRIINNAAQGISHIFLEVASGFYKEGLFTEAQIYLQMVLYLEPSSAQAHFLLANHYENNHDYNQAITHYQQINKMSDFYWQSQVNIALNLIKNNELQAAKKHLLSLSKQHPSDYEVLLILADILRTEGKPQEAINLYTQILSNTIKIPSHYWYAYYMRAISYDQIQMPDKAEADLLQAIALNPEQGEVLNYLGYSWVNAGKNIAKAKKMIEKALEQDPDNPQFIDSMGWAFFADKQYIEAIKYLESALEFLPTDPTINDHLGDVYLEAGRTHEAIFQWKRALRFSPAEPEVEKIKAKIDNQSTATR